jgi:cyclohexanecarboxyl-CoA dehydrogenase
MEFCFSKEEDLWRWAVKDFADRELAPKEFKTFDQSLRDTLKKMGELGFFGVKLPEEYGGDPASWVMLGILMEEIARVNVGIAHFLMVSHEAALSLATHGTDEVKAEWLPHLIKGNKVACISVTEPNAGCDFTALITKGAADGDCYTISGEKGPVSFGMEADVTVSLVRTGPEGVGGVTAMLIPLNLPGIRRLPITNMGLHLSAPASLRFDEAQIPVRYRIGGEGEGLRLNAETGLFSDLNQIMSGLVSLGVAQAALKLAIAYSKERFAFGKPIGSFEAISHKIAEDSTLIEAAGWLCYRALALKDQGSPNAKEAAMCGWWSPKVAYQVIQDSLLIHGHAGYSDDHPFQQMLRDVVAFEMISGTEQMLKLIVSRETMGQVAMPDTVSEAITYR